VFGVTPAVPCNDVGGGGISIAGGLDGHGDLTFSHLWLHDLAIQMQGAYARNVVLEESCLERNASTASCHSEAWAAWGPSDRVTVRNNLLSDIEGTAFIAIGNADHWEVYNNVFMCTPGRPYACGVGNGTIGTTDHDYEEANFWRVHHNVFVNIVNATVDLDSPVGPEADENVVSNNVFFANSAVGFSGVAEHDFNWFFDNGGGSEDAALAGSEPHGQRGTADPFVDWEAGDFHLAAPTEEGVALPAPFDRDPDGRPRGEDGTWDRGVFEYRE